MTPSYKLQNIGKVSALTCALTYIIGFVILINLLAPYGYGTNQVDAVGVVRLIYETPHALILFNTIIYIINAIALTFLVLVVSGDIGPKANVLSSVSRAFGLMWATLVLGAGMIGNVAVETAYHQYLIDPVSAAVAWKLMHKIELGLGGGNEIAGAIWFLCVGLGFQRQSRSARFIAIFAVTIGFCGFLTLLPVVGEITGAIFGVGAIVWFLLIAFSL